MYTRDLNHQQGWGLTDCGDNRPQLFLVGVSNYKQLSNKKAEKINVAF